MRISDWSSDVCSSDLVVAISDDAADRRWIGALRIAESAADAELQAVAALHDQCAEHAGVLAAPGRMPDPPRLGILVGPVLDQVVAAIRSEERRVGKECVSSCNFRWSQ